MWRRVIVRKMMQRRVNTAQLCLMQIWIIAIYSNGGRNIHHHAKARKHPKPNHHPNYFPIMKEVQQAAVAFKKLTRIKETKTLHLLISTKPLHNKLHRNQSGLNNLIEGLRQMMALLNWVFCAHVIRIWPILGPVWTIC